jgi:hypothetical protein
MAMNTTEKQRLMNAVPDRLVVAFRGKSSIEISYTPKTDRTLYDICDLNGRILKTGGISDSKTQVDVSDLHEDQYILLVLDGDQLCSKKFTIAPPSSR